ncbi:hypothetical protein OEZ83_26700, partial [Leclercia adecarboxylata]|uniref:hypothetical protein n=1 Tax=Leclercia adecarboxylata TaxID=83655 RepID=UPI00234D9E18
LFSLSPQALVGSQLAPMTTLLRRKAVFEDVPFQLKPFLGAEVVLLNMVIYWNRCRVCQLQDLQFTVQHRRR